MARSERSVTEEVTGGDRGGRLPRRPGGSSVGDRTRLAAPTRIDTLSGASTEFARDGQVRLAGAREVAGHDRDEQD